MMKEVRGFEINSEDERRWRLTNLWKRGGPDSERYFRTKRCTRQRWRPPETIETPWLCLGGQESRSQNLENTKKNTVRIEYRFHTEHGLQMWRRSFSNLFKPRDQYKWSLQQWDRGSCWDKSWKKRTLNQLGSGKLLKLERICFINELKSCNSR
jgi:hypothetical protein